MQDEEKTVIQTLYVFMIVSLIGTALVSVSSLIASQGAFTSFTLSGLMGMLTCLVVLWLLRIKQFTLPRIFLPSAAYLLATYLIFTGATVGVRDDSVLLYSLVVAMAGLLLGKTGVIVFGVLSMLAVESSVIAEVNGLIVNPSPTSSTSYSTLVTVGVIYGLTFAMLYILVNILTRNLANARSSQQALTQTNQELLSIRESLQEQVTERTRAAEIARLDAEMARHEAESQVWFTSGQAQLAEKMRGEQSLEMLANNVTSQICRYLGAQTGAFFLVSGQRLKLTGRYAYTERAGQKDEFGFGENLVGEAAKANRIIRVNNIAADAPLVSSALGNAKPKQLLLAPIGTDGQVFGVVELATLNRFSGEHEAFLRRVSENIAIAFRTAQTRERIAAMLSDSQRQAEELQSQEEELRAANEELQAQADEMTVKK